MRGLVLCDVSKVCPLMCDNHSSEEHSRESVGDQVAPRDVEGVEGLLHYHTSTAMIVTIFLYIGYIVVGMHRLVSGVGDWGAGGWSPRSVCESSVEGVGGRLSTGERLLHCFCIYFICVIATKSK